LGWEGGLALETEKNSKPETCSKNAPRTPSRLHAVLGGVSERKTPGLHKASTAKLTKLWHVPLTISTDKYHDLQERSIAETPPLKTDLDFRELGAFTHLSLI